MSDMRVKVGVKGSAGGYMPKEVRKRARALGGSPGAQELRGGHRRLPRTAPGSHNRREENGANHTWHLAGS